MITIIYQFLNAGQISTTAQSNSSYHGNESHTPSLLVKPFQSSSFNYHQRYTITRNLSKSLQGLSMESLYSTLIVNSTGVPDPTPVTKPAITEPTVLPGLYIIILIFLPAIVGTLLIVLCPIVCFACGFRHCCKCDENRHYRRRTYYRLL